MKKILVAVLFTILPSFSYAAGWCTTIECYVSRSTPLAPQCIMQCNETTGATIQLGNEELSLSCTTSGGNRVYCPNYVAPTQTTQTENTGTTTAQTNTSGGTTYTVTTTTGGTTTTSQVNVQDPSAGSSGDATNTLSQVLLDLTNETYPTGSTRGNITEVPYDQFFRPIKNTSSGTNATQSTTSTGQTATTSTVVAGSCSQTFVKSLKLYDESDDVLKVQQFLNKDAETKISGTSAGSSGKETRFFGQRVLDAVKRFQKKYAGDILTPVKLTTPSGMWGASTRAKANALVCAGGQ